MKTPSQPTWAIIPDRPLDARTVLIQLYWAAIRAVAPGPALRHALEKLPREELKGPVWIVSVGKAANPMAIAAVDFLAKHHRAPAGGVVVSPRQIPAPHEKLLSVVGDHPIPGEQSFFAARMVEEVTQQVKPSDEVWVLLSGGATCLMAAPEGTLRPEELTQLFEMLLGSGLDIGMMNLVRKRFTRWGAGRLALAVAPARVRNYIISDVIGDDVAAIGSGPCVPDPCTATELIQILEGAHLWNRLPMAARNYLHRVEHHPEAETPKAGDDTFANVERKIVASNRIALEAAAARARDFGYEPRILGSSLAGEAAEVGKRLATALLSYCAPTSPPLTGRAGRTCLIWGGETTVTLGAEPGSGGRCQELALAAAAELAQAKSARTTTLLACGTDGRDGATDAAGAIVDRETWGAIRRAGRDPARDLAAHDSHPALDAAKVLLRTDLTFTNVMDVMIGICGAPDATMWPPKTPGGSIAKITESVKKRVLGG